MKKLIIILLIALNIVSYAQNGMKVNGAKVKVRENAYLRIQDATDGNLSIKNNGELVLSGCLSVENDLTTSNGIVAVKTNSVSCGSIIVDGAVNAYATVDYNMQAGKWHGLTSPVASFEVEQLLTGAWVYAYNEAGTTAETAWIPYNTGDIIAPPKGYIARFSDNRTISFEGVLNHGNMNIALTRDFQGYNLVGNPYPSAIDWEDADWDKTGLGNTIYIWKQGTGYATYSTGGAQTNEGSRYIAPLQGFFVVDNVGGTNLVFNNNIRQHNTMQGVYKNEDKEKLSNFIRLKSSSNLNYSDETVIYFAEGTNDAYKLLVGDQKVPQIYSKNNAGQNFAVQKISTVKEETIIPINFYCGESNTYQIQITEFSFDENFNLFLKDLVTGTIVPLDLGSSIAFNYSTGSPDSRFELLINPVVTSIDAINYNENPIIYYYDNSVIINFKQSSEIEYVIEIYDINGKKLNQKKTTEQIVYLPLFEKGIFLVRVINNENIFTQKIPAL